MSSTLDPESLGNAAILHASDVADTSRPKLMGRQVAGESFLRGFARHAQVEKFYCLSPNKAEASDFESRLRAAGARAPIGWIPNESPRGLSVPGCLYAGTPVIGAFAWARRRGDQRGYSLCGLTHTTASSGAMQALGELVVAPLQSWDAVICTSVAVRAMVDRLLDDYSEYLSEALGATRVSRPQLPVIPLGVDTEMLAPGAEREALLRKRWRQRLGIPPGDTVALFIGRLSFHAKANPFPMYVALEQAAQRTGRKLHLIQSGWFANEGTEKVFRDNARALAPSVQHHFLDGRKPEMRETLWFAADYFISLSDNIQETFGLTPVEAMAAGLPVIASDWDGYRDTLTNDETCFRIPTLSLPAGAGEELAAQHEARNLTYDQYIGYSSLATSVDMRATIAACECLTADPAKARAMGAAGRAEAQRRFDWSHIVRQYQELWGELAKRRQSETERAARTKGAPASPLHADPYRLFESYPTRAIDRGDQLKLAESRDGVTLASARSSGLLGYAQQLLLEPEECERLLTSIGSREGGTVAEQVDSYPDPRRARALRTLAWLAKAGLIEINPA